MRSATFLKAILVLAILVVPSCGGDDPDEGRAKLQKLGGKTPDKAGTGEGTPSKDDKTGSTGTGTGSGATDKNEGPAPSSITSAKNQAKVKALRARLKAAKSEDSKMELLGDVADLGKPAKPMVRDVSRFLKDESPDVRTYALSAIAAINPDGCRPHLEAGLKDGETLVRVQALKCWRQAGIKDLTPLFNLLEGEIEEQVQTAAGVVIRELGQEFHVPTVVRLVDEVSVNSARPMIEFLVAKKATKHVDKIREFLECDSPSLRVAVARGLGDLGAKSKETLSSLVAALGDDDSRVRRAANESLKKLTKQDFDFDEDAPEAKRTAALNAWKEWVKKNG